MHDPRAVGCGVAEQEGRFQAAATDQVRCGFPERAPLGEHRLVNARLGYGIGVVVEERGRAGEWYRVLAAIALVFGVQRLHVVVRVEVRHERSQVLERLGEVEAEPPHVGEHGNVGNVTGLKARDELGRHFLVRLDDILGDADVGVRLVETLDHRHRGITVGATWERPQEGNLNRPTLDERRRGEGSACGTDGPDAGESGTGACGALDQRTSTNVVDHGLRSSLTGSCYERPTWPLI